MTLTLTGGEAASVLVNDTSKDSKPIKQINSLVILIDKDVAGPLPLLLRDLGEEIITEGDLITSHVLSYMNNEYNYDDLDHLITTVTRNGNFTSEFQSEIADLIPAFADINYEDIVKLVGVENIENVLNYIAGADGNYVA